MMLPNQPTCPVCKNPMDEVDSFKAKKGNKTVEVTVYSCLKDKTFDKTVKAVA